jgi:histidinol-phosphate aminotransferase
MLTQEDIEKLIRPGLKKIAPYLPVEPPQVLAKRIGFDVKDIIKLDANENPYGCSDRVRKAMAQYPFYSIYPDPIQRELRNSLEKYTGFKSENIIPGSGSDELIELILRLFLEPGDKVINCPPTFSMYKFSTEICLGELVDIPRKPDFSIDLSAIKKAIDKKTRVVFIASPNNPSGNAIDTADVISLLDSDVIVVIDEAYAEFAETSVDELVLDYDNLFVLHTFSKWAGLAGLRVGYGIMPSFIVNHLITIKQPYNVNAAAQVAAIESLKDLDYLRATIDSIKKERVRLNKKLKGISRLECYDSQSNFILCRVRSGDAQNIHRELQNKGIFVRYYKNPELENYIRISVGKPEHTDRLIAALKEIS